MSASEDQYAQEWAEREMAQSQASLPQFNFVAACDMPIKPIAWLIRDYIEEDALAVMYGPPGAGKSFVALDMSCCIASGIDFHGHRIKQGAVFYIAGEGHNGLARRLSAWSLHNGVERPTQMFISDAPTDLSSALNAAIVGDAIQQLADAAGIKPALIVIDTMARNFGGDENSATDVGQFIRHADTLRRRWKATVLIIHHSGKVGDKGARGSSALKGAVDAEYEVNRGAEDKVIRLTPRKMKDAEEPQPLAFELIGLPVTDDTGSLVGGAALKLTEYTPPATAVKSGMGKNQQKALAILEQIYAEISDRLATQGRENHPVHILTEDWRLKCESQDMPRNRFKEALDALIKRNAVGLDGPHVVLLDEPVRNVRASLGDPDDSDINAQVPFGQIGQVSDEIRRMEYGNENHAHK